MIADFEALQESETSEINVKRVKNQEICQKRDCEFPCAYSSKTIIDSGKKPRATR